MNTNQNVYNLKCKGEQMPALAAAPPGHMNLKQSPSHESPAGQRTTDSEIVFNWIIPSQCRPGTPAASILWSQPDPGCTSMWSLRPGSCAGGPQVTRATRMPGHWAVRGTPPGHAAGSYVVIMSVVTWSNDTVVMSRKSHQSIKLNSNNDEIDFSIILYVLMSRNGCWLFH